jgi:hypothetical protein
MKMITTAQNLANIFDNDGQCRRDADGRNMRDVAESMGAAVQYPNGRGVSPIVYVFDDGSAIVEADGCWDYRADGCESACMRGSGTRRERCRCAA